MAMDPSQCGEVNGVPNAAGTDCECAPDHHWVARPGMPHGGICEPNPPNANPLDYSRVIPAAESFEDPICVEGFTLVNGVCEQDASDSGMAGDGVAEEDPPDSDSSMPICPVNYFYDDTYEWSDETGDRIGACVPDPTFLVCNQGFHYQPSGEKGTDSLLAGGTCVEDYSPPVQADEVSPEDLIEESVIVEEVQAALEAAGPVFTPVVGCCTTEIGNAIVTGLLENYRSELETIY